MGGTYRGLANPRRWWYRGDSLVGGRIGSPVIMSFLTVLLSAIAFFKVKDLAEI
jgi:hypothetical protein